MYKDRDEVVRKAYVDVCGAVDGLHPVDEVRAMHEIADMVRRHAEYRERENTEHGVPETGGEAVDHETRESIDRAQGALHGERP